LHIENVYLKLELKTVFLAVGTMEKQRKDEYSILKRILRTRESVRN
jgi:hypothetical protein